MSSIDTILRKGLIKQVSSLGKDDYFISECIKKRSPHQNEKQKTCVLVFHKMT